MSSNNPLNPSNVQEETIRKQQNEATLNTVQTPEQEQDDEPKNENDQQEKDKTATAAIPTTPSPRFEGNSSGDLLDASKKIVEFLLKMMQSVQEELKAFKGQIDNQKNSLRNKALATEKLMESVTTKKTELGNTGKRLNILKRETELLSKKATNLQDKTEIIKLQRLHALLEQQKNALETKFTELQKIAPSFKKSELEDPTLKKSSGLKDKLQGAAQAALGAPKALAVGLGKLLKNGPDYMKGSVAQLKLDELKKREHDINEYAKAAEKALPDIAGDLEKLTKNIQDLNSKIDQKSQQLMEIDPQAGNISSQNSRIQTNKKLNATHLEEEQDNSQSRSAPK